MDSSVAPEDCQEHKRWIKMEDVQTVMASMPTHRNILFSDGKTKLIDCVYYMEKPKALVKFILNIADINTALPSDSPLWPGCTPLHLAVMFSENMKSEAKAANLVQQFLSQGASIHVQDCRGATPLHLAFYLELQHIVSTLFRNLEKKSQEIPNLLDKQNLSHLHIFCTTDDHRNSLARKLLFSEQNLESTINVAYQGKALDNVKPGWTPLHIAVDQLQLSLVELLLQRGANVACKDTRGHTAVQLLFGANTKSNSIVPNVRKLLAELLFAAEQWDESLAEGDGLTRLHVAVWFNDVESVKRLLDLRANVEAAVNVPEGKDLGEFAGCTALHVAVIRNHYDIVKVFLERGANLLAKNHDGTSLLLDALTTYPGKIGDAFVQLICSDDVLQRRLEEELGVTMLHVACYIRDVELVEATLRKGTDVNVRVHELSDFWSGYTPLHALMTSDTTNWYDGKTMGVLRTLIQNDCDIDRQDSTGKTAFQLVLSLRNCYYTDYATTIFLLIGADITIVDRSGKSAMSYALQLYSHCSEHKIGAVNEIVSQLLLRIYKMKFVGMDVIEIDETLATAALQEHNVIPDFPGQIAFYDQVQATEKIKIGQRGLSLRSFLYETYAISMYPSLTPKDRVEVAAFFDSFDYLGFREVSPLLKLREVSPLLKLQYRKAVARLSLIDLARDALKTFISNFPDLCVDIILKYLSNSQLKQLVAASAEDTDK